MSKRSYHWWPCDRFQHVSYFSVFLLLACNSFSTPLSWKMFNSPWWNVFFWFFSKRVTVFFSDHGMTHNPWVGHIPCQTWSQTNYLKTWLPKHLKWKLSLSIFDIQGLIVIKLCSSSFMKQWMWDSRQVLSWKYLSASTEYSFYDKETFLFFDSYYCYALNIIF